MQKKGKTHLSYYCNNKHAWKQARDKGTLPAQKYLKLLSINMKILTSVLFSTFFFYLLCAFSSTKNTSKNNTKAATCRHQTSSVLLAETKIEKATKQTESSRCGPLKHNEPEIKKKLKKWYIFFLLLVNYDEFCQNWQLCCYDRSKMRSELWKMQVRSLAMNRSRLNCKNKVQDWKNAQKTRRSAELQLSLSSREALRLNNTKASLKEPIILKWKPILPCATLFLFSWNTRNFMNCSHLNSAFSSFSFLILPFTTRCKNCSDTLLTCKRGFPNEEETTAVPVL